MFNGYETTSSKIQQTIFLNMWFHKVYRSNLLGRFAAQAFTRRSVKACEQLLNHFAENTQDASSHRVQHFVRFFLSILWQINTTGRSLRSLWNNLERPMGQSWSRLGVNRRSKQVVSCVVHIDCLTHVSVDLQCQRNQRHENRVRMVRDHHTQTIHVCTSTIWYLRLPHNVYVYTVIDCN